MLLGYSYSWCHLFKKLTLQILCYSAKHWTSLQLANLICLLANRYWSSEINYPYQTRKKCIYLQWWNAKKLTWCTGVITYHTSLWLCTFNVLVQIPCMLPPQEWFIHTIKQRKWGKAICTNDELWKTLGTKVGAQLFIWLKWKLAGSSGTFLGSTLSWKKKAWWGVSIV